MHSTKDSVTTCTTENVSCNLAKNTAHRQTGIVLFFLFLLNKNTHWEKSLFQPEGHLKSQATEIRLPGEWGRRWHWHGGGWWVQHPGSRQGSSPLMHTGLSAQSGGSWSMAHLLGVMDKNRFSQWEGKAGRTTPLSPHCPSPLKPKAERRIQSQLSHRRVTVE